MKGIADIECKNDRCRSFSVNDGRESVSPSQALALEARVSSVQSELENALQSARDAEATQESDVSRLKKELEKARGEGDALLQQREEAGADVLALRAAVADATAGKEDESRRAAQSVVEVEDLRLEWENERRKRDAEVAELKVILM